MIVVRKPASQYILPLHSSQNDGNRRGSPHHCDEPRLLHFDRPIPLAGDPAIGNHDCTRPRGTSARTKTAPGRETPPAWRQARKANGRRHPADGGCHQLRNDRERIAGPNLARRRSRGDRAKPARVVRNCFAGSSRRDLGIRLAILIDRFACLSRADRSIDAGEGRSSSHGNHCAGVDAGHRTKREPEDCNPLAWGDHSGSTLAVFSTVVERKVGAPCGLPVMVRE